MSTILSAPAPRRAYDQTAPFYDALTAHHDYELWVGRLLAVAADHGLRGRRVLDVGCGTGKSLEPFLRRGWRATGCDASPGMLERARAKLGSRATLHPGDITDLPRFGAFDLVVALDDVLNHVCDPDDLAGAFAGMASNLADGGLVLFDVNTLATYRGFFSETSCIETPGLVLVWRGQGDGDVRPGQQVEALLDVFTRVPGEGEGWRRARVRHCQRHHPEAEVRRALASAGLQVVALVGQDLSAVMEPRVQELRHTKAVYVARRAPTDTDADGGR